MNSQRIGGDKRKLDKYRLSRHSDQCLLSDTNIHMVLVMTVFENGGAVGSAVG